MKKVFAIMALVAAMFVANNAQAQLSVNLGYAPETFSSTINTTTTTSGYQGFFGGVTYNLGVAKGIGVALGAQYRLNLTSSESTLLTVTTKISDTQHLIDIPVLLNYGIAVNRQFKIVPFVGPMCSFAVAGNTKTTTHSSVTPLADTEINKDWYGDNSNNSRMNLNLVFGAAFNYEQFKLFGGYRLGLLDQNKADGVTVKTSGFFIGLGMGI